LGAGNSIYLHKHLYIVETKFFGNCSCFLDDCVKRHFICFDYRTGLDYRAAYCIVDFQLRIQKQRAENNFLYSGQDAVKEILQTDILPKSHRYGMFGRKYGDCIRYDAIRRPWVYGIISIQEACELYTECRPDYLRQGILEYIRKACEDQWKYQKYASLRNKMTAIVNKIRWCIEREERELLMNELLINILNIKTK